MVITGDNTTGNWSECDPDDMFFANVIPIAYADELDLRTPEVKG